MPRNLTQQAEFRKKAVNYLSFRLKKKFGCSQDESFRKVANFLQIDESELTMNIAQSSVDWEEICDSMIPYQEKKNHLLLTKIGREYASIWTTPVMLKKSIIDATAAIRFVLSAAEIHDYWTQRQGPEYKKTCRAYLVGKTVKQTTVSMYRPITKSGDPRIWFYGMKDFCESGDELIVTCINGACYVLNMTKIDYESERDACLAQIARLKGQTAPAEPVLPLKEQIYAQLFTEDISEVALELLEKMKALVGQPLRNPVRKAGKRADTDVGMAVEAALGIPPNSKRAPDYRGIELKAWRGGRKNRHALFTQVPDWDKSFCGSIREFVDLVGYPSRKEEVQSGVGDDAKELRCTVNSIKANAQFLLLRVDDSEDRVVELRTSPIVQDLLVWPGDLLRTRLKEKHPETFWIECRTEIEPDGQESFFLNRIHYTRHPLLSRLMSLIESGRITLDHMISYKKKTTKSGEVRWGLSEKGPSWKIHDNDFDQLFPQPKTFELV